MEQVIKRQRSFFNSGKTKDIAFRLAMLKRLQDAVEKRERVFLKALKDDLNKSAYEAYLTEIQIVQTELKTAIRHLKKWARPKRVKTPVTHFPSSSWVYSEPYGVVLILAPWNYPFQLALVPLIGAIAAGNCAVIKPSKSSPAVSSAIRDMIEDLWDDQYLYCVGEDISYEEILGQSYDLIFFTGSERVGKIVMESAAQHLTPVVLELGGKSPCIVEKSANLKVAAKRIAWGKFLNAGQTCVAPDYLLVDKTVADQFLYDLKQSIQELYGDALQNPDYPKIISRHHFDRLSDLLDSAEHLYGGQRNQERCQIAPALLLNADWEDDIMKDEIFGPLFPVISFEDFNDVIRRIQKRPKPLACYLFSEDRALIRRVLSELSFGGGCVNDVIMHLANHHLPFGGVGNSGMGNYHGYYSFRIFSHQKAVLRAGTGVDLPFRYPPYREDRLETIKRLTK